jgi:SAM-dependent methyltransferase
MEGESAWRGEGARPPPEQVRPVDDRLTASAALARLRRGEWLVYRGNFKNARQLLAALGRRLQATARGVPLDIFRTQRRAREREHEILSRLLVELDAAGRLRLHDAADVGEAVRWRWGEPREGLVPLRQLLGVVGAFEWYRRGVPVAGLHGKLHPRYGVFLPTRPEYPELAAAIPDPAGRVVFDVGAGTGVLGFLLLERGAARVIATDIEPSAVASATEDARALGFGERFEARVGGLFPEGRADVVVCNPPWLPGEARTALDLAVYDPGEGFLRGFVAGLREHLAPGGAGYLLLSDFAERLGLRGAGTLETLAAEAGLTLEPLARASPRHGRAKDPDDPLHALRSAEVVTLYRLASAAQPEAQAEPEREDHRRDADHESPGNAAGGGNGGRR